MGGRHALLIMPARTEVYCPVVARQLDDNAIAARLGPPARVPWATSRPVRACPRSTPRAGRLSHACRKDTDLRTSEVARAAPPQDRCMNVTLPTSCPLYRRPRMKALSRMSFPGQVLRATSGTVRKASSPSDEWVRNVARLLGFHLYACGVVPGQLFTCS